MAPSRSKAETETLARFDEAERSLHLYTANKAVARKWTLRGYPVVEICNSRGEVTGWRADGLPLRCLSWRSLARKTDSAPRRPPSRRRSDDGSPGGRTNDLPEGRV